MGATRFDYAVTPDRVAYSRQRGHSIVDLAILVANRSDEDVPCPQITIRIPAGITSDTLTDDPLVISGAPGPSTPWAVGIAGEQLWRATPLPPTVGLARGQQMAILLSNIVVNQTRGNPAVEIVEHTDIARATTVTVHKTHPSNVDGERPQIVEFIADPVRVALGGNVTLSWRVAHAQSGTLEPDGVVLDRERIARGELTLPVYRSTAFALVALGPGGSVHAPAEVAVMPVGIPSFAATPAEVLPGHPVRLDWFTEYATSCEIDQGIGPVPRWGQIEVKPRRTTIYTLRANGLDPRSQAVTVTVVPQQPPVDKEQR